MTIHEKHMHLIDKVNNAETELEHSCAEHYLKGWRDGVEYAGRGINYLHADLHQKNRGHRRDMDAGVFLDWKPNRKRNDTYL